MSDDNGSKHNLAEWGLLAYIGWLFYIWYDLYKDIRADQEASEPSEPRKFKPLGVLWKIVKYIGYMFLIAIGCGILVGSPIFFVKIICVFGVIYLVKVWYDKHIKTLKVKREKNR